MKAIDICPNCGEYKGQLCHCAVKPQHTPTPWVLEKDEIKSNDKRICQIYDGDGVGWFCALEDKEAKANAAYIVRAVNSHEELLKALKIVVAGYEAERGSDFDWVDWYDKAKKAIAKAEWKGE